MSHNCLLNFLRVLFLTFGLLMLGCQTPSIDLFSGKKMPDVDHEIISLPAPRSVSFSKEVRPILNNRCVVCHGCYDAPCQLKLSSYEGLERGASKSVVYDGARLNPVEPTRLFVDAKSKKEWRSKGFYSVLNESSHESYRDNLEKSVFYRMIQMKQRQPQPRTGAVAKELGPNLNRQNYCPTQEELPHFMEQHSNWGMPFGLPNLTEREYETLVLWLAQGAQTDQKATLLKKAERKSLNAWEQLLNQKDLKSQLISRYLYEHLFLAHIQFVQFDKRRFYRLVRSRTPSGNPVDEIATVRPYDSPGVGALYYRFVEESSAIVAKNHLVYKLGPQTYKRWKSLFYDKDFQVTALPSYDVDQASNPFRTFTQIPAQSRAEFFMDTPHFFIESFIKGPVCRGQVALNVIEDHFWVFFVDPKKDISVVQPEFARRMVDYGRLPAEHKSEIKVLSIWTDYWQQQQEYMRAKESYMQQIHSKDENHALEHLLISKKTGLTVFRHSDSASVREGLWGDYPETAWVIDYPLFEKIHYLLVAGFNVFGGVGHQLNTRLYMDFLRLEGENQFLSFLPRQSRHQLRQQWYKGLRASLVQRVSSPVEWANIESKVIYKTAHPKLELFERLAQKYERTSKNKDPIQRCQARKCLKGTNNSLVANVYKELGLLSKVQGSKLQPLPDIAFLRVRFPRKRDRVFTLIRNKAYDNVSFFLQDEDQRSHADLEEDTLSVISGLEGSYPNFFFDVSASEISQFVSDFQSIVNEDDWKVFLGRYGIKRTNSKFWSLSDWFYNWSLKEDTTRAGLFDLNRYINP